ncbi:MAG: glycogen synthase [Syntrophobacteraceae bacterium]
MKIAILTNEYPPNIYGGAGVHVENLVRELAPADGGAHSIEVLCFGNQSGSERGIRVTGVDSVPGLDFSDTGIAKVADALLRDVGMMGILSGADIVHCHTWYTHFAGCLLKHLLGVPLVLTTHSLEPHRPWKREQLGPAYMVSSWIERTAYQNADGVIAVSGAMKADVQSLYGVPPEKVRVIYNGIDATCYVPDLNKSVLSKYGIDPDIPYLLFVGRITRQKGIIHLVEAIRHIRPGVQIVLCAGAPDTPDIGSEMESRIEEAKKNTSNPIIWITGFLPKDEITALYSLASIFICPSVYEPFGLINIEAMACETAVVGAAVGGIPEIVVDGETGLLVPFEACGGTNPEPKEPERFSRDLADAVNRLLSAPERAREMGMLGRKRVEEVFSWRSVAGQTLAFYRALAGKD